MERRYFPGTVDSLDSLREYVGELAERAGLPRKKVYSLKLAIDEIATNIILYGYEAAGIKAGYSLTSEITAEQLVLTLEDEAAEFNPLARELPSAEDLQQELEDRQIGGLGIFLTIHGVDEFTHEYRDGRNRNRFVMKMDKS